MTMQKCQECGTERCPRCGEKKDCCGSGGDCPVIDPIKQAPAMDKATYFNVTSLTTQWQYFYFPIDVIVKPTSYGGGSDNSYSGIQVVAGNLPQSSAGVDTPWEVVGAGKAFSIPCGGYWMRSDNSSNIVNVRIYPAKLAEVRGISRGFFRVPTFATVGVASAQALAAKVGRRVLVLVNTSTAAISIAFGATAAVLYSGITIYPGVPVTLTDGDCPEDAMNAIAAVAASNLAIQEG